MSGLQPGDLIDGRFAIERVAGHGGMGTVYRAIDRTSGAVVALKVLHATAGQGARFVREAEVLAVLEHPAIVRYIAHGAAPAGAPYLALEWLEGEDLSSRLARNGLTTTESVGLVLRVAEALAAAHALGIVHRDIKPSNLLLVGGRPEAVTLLDFGIARVSTATHTQTGTVLGTPAYMAPEQARGERGVDARVDVFALGAVFYECLTGRPPFVGEHVMAVLANALYLDELLRAMADGREDEAPTTVLAMVEARIDGLDVTARRVLRAASVFGEACWLRGLCALLTDLPQAETERWLRDLIAREQLVERSSSRFPGEREVAFRHAIVREAAYGMLTERDRVTGHRLAGAWLESAGEREPIVLAEHFERGGQPLRAIADWRRAAEEAMYGNDFDAVFARVDRAIACGARDEELGHLRLLEADAAFWLGESVRVETAGDAALLHLPEESTAWFRARSRAVIAGSRHGRSDRLRELGADLLARELPPMSLAWVDAASETIVHLLRAADVELAEALLERVAAAASSLAAHEPAVAGHIHRVRAWHELYRGADVASLNEEEAAAESRAGDLRSECRHRAGVAYQRMLLADYAGAERAYRAALHSPERMGLNGVVAETKHNLGLVLTRLGRLDDGIALEREALADFEVLDLRMTAACHKYLAVFLLEAGRLDEAEIHARAAVAVPELAPAFRPHVLATVANVLLARGDVEGAREAARHAVELMAAMSVVEEGEAFVCVTYARVLEAAGDREGARVAIFAARDNVLARAANIPDLAWRKRFLEGVPECADAIRFAIAFA